MRWEVTDLVGPKNQANDGREHSRWGAQTGYCVVGGQKVPLQRPRVSGVRNREVPQGSYEMQQRASLMEDAMWQRLCTASPPGATAKWCGNWSNPTESKSRR